MSLPVSSSSICGSGLVDDCITVTVVVVASLVVAVVLISVVVAVVLITVVAAVLLGVGLGAEKDK